MNQFSFVGRIAEIPELERHPVGWNTCLLSLKIQRPFPDPDGTYRCDLVEVEVSRGAAETLAVCAQVDSWVTVRGRVERFDDPARNTETEKSENGMTERKADPSRMDAESVSRAPLPDFSKPGSRKAQPVGASAGQKKSLSKKQSREEYLKEEKMRIRTPVGSYRFVAEHVEFIH